MFSGCRHCPSPAKTQDIFHPCIFFIRKFKVLRGTCLPSELSLPQHYLYRSLSGASCTKKKIPNSEGDTLPKTFTSSKGFPVLFITKFLQLWATLLTWGPDLDWPDRAIMLHSSYAQFMEPGLYLPSAKSIKVKAPTWSIFQLRAKGSPLLTKITFS